MALIAGLILVGILLVILEIIVLPGMVAGVIGAVMMVMGIVKAYADFGQTVGHITFASTAMLTFLAIYTSLKAKAWNRFGLKETIDGRVNEINQLQIKEGDEGVALSALRPSGTVLIGDKRVEAHTPGELIDAGTRVVVLGVTSSKVLVRSVQS